MGSDEVHSSSLQWLLSSQDYFESKFLRVWSHDKGVLCQTTDFVELKHTKQLFLSWEFNPCTQSTARKFSVLVETIVIKWNLSFCKWWQGIKKNEMCSIEHFHFCNDVPFLFFAFFHTLLTTYKNLWFKYGKFNFNFLPQTMATLGHFFQKKIGWTSCRPFLLSPSPKNPLSSHPPLSLQKHSDCKN